jgi:LacI family transcriptional regulator
LRLGRSDLIGVLLPDIANPVFAPILGGIAEVLSAEGYAPIVADAGNASSQQISFVERLLSRRVDGLILATVSQDDELVGFCIRRGLPVILVNRSEARDRVSSVGGSRPSSWTCRVHVAWGSRRRSRVMPRGRRPSTAALTS